MQDENINTALTPVTVPESIAPLDLSETRDRIKILHNQVVEGLRRTTPTIISLGKELLSVKAQMPHGDFTCWFNSSLFSFKIRTANMYMGLARAAAKNARLAELEPYAAYQRAKLITVRPTSRTAKKEEKSDSTDPQSATQNAGPNETKSVFRIGEMFLEEVGESLQWKLTQDGWRNALANALADERGFEKALQRGLLLKLEPQP